MRAIEEAFGLDQRRVSSGLVKASAQFKLMQEVALIQAGQQAVQPRHATKNLWQIQADEIRVKIVGGVVWLATSMAVNHRFVVWGEVSVRRNKQLIQRLMTQTRLAFRPCHQILIVTDGFRAYAAAIRKAFADKVYSGGRGRPPLVTWSNLAIAQVIKHPTFRSPIQHATTQDPIPFLVQRIERGCATLVSHIILSSQRLSTAVINTASIERFNATLRTWIAPFTRRSRCLVRSADKVQAHFFLTTVLYNFSRVHDSLGVSPAQSFGLTDRLWSLQDLLLFKPSLFKHHRLSLPTP